jgi:Cdc6-like AAA superfamily ATPase
MSNVEEIKIKDAVEPCKFNFSCDDVIDENIPHPLPGNKEGWFRMAIIGKSGSGKTNLLRYLTEKGGKNKIYAKRFYNVYYTSPSVKTMDSRPKLPDCNFYESIKHIPEIFADLQSEDKEGRSLIIMDDINHELKINGQDYMKKLYCNNRHIGNSLIDEDTGKQISGGAVSSILVAQRLNNIPRYIRSQITHYCIFDCRSTKSELNTIFEELLHVDKNDFNHIISRVFSKPYNFIFIDTTKSRIYNGFQSEFVLNLDKFL